MKEQIRGLAHIGIITNDLEKSLTFYRALGGVVTDTAVIPTPQGEKRLVLVDVSGTVVELIAPPTKTALCEGVISHFALYVDDIDAVSEKLREAGISGFETPEKRVLDIFGGITNRFLAGPDGERIELMEKKA